MDRGYLAEVHPEVIILEPPDLDAAILGLVDLSDGTTHLVYSRKGLVTQLQNQGMTWEDAEEWYEFNIAGAHLGPNSPIYLELEWGD